MTDAHPPDGRAAIHLLTRRTHAPVLELIDAQDQSVRLPFILTDHAPGSTTFCWTAYPPQVDVGGLRFRIELRHKTYTAPYGKGSFDYFETNLNELWIQNGQVFAYRPSRNMSRSVVEKIDAFSGSLPGRPVYIYLPRGYSQHKDRRYPLIFMHDGQNCFESHAGDSFAGTWQADRTADRLIAAGQMRECIIVGVGNGNDRRVAEYMPPDVTFTPPTPDDQPDFRPVVGAADKTAKFYQNEILPFVEQHYRVAQGRSQRAVLGSSMGGLFSLYLGWSHPDLAANIGALSTSFWITIPDGGTFAESPLLAQLASERPDLRLWLDSGTVSAETQDGMHETMQARDALLNNGWTLGDNFQYLLAEGANHSEQAWAARLDQVFRFLLPF